MITTVCLVNTLITYSYIVTLMRIFKIYSLGKIQTYNTILTVVTMPYITSPGLIYFIAEIT